MPKVARTLNPLHFEDLEPHRFEDLVRQLAYDFREWASIEATGRLGSDEGMDIRATALTSSSTPVDEEAAEADEEGARERAPERRTWIFQCKREQKLTPKKVQKIVADNLSGLEEEPYGYILAAACDFSKASRDAFRRQCLGHGVQEYVLWGKAELEDMLFLPKNDHLLFAYFGISLQTRRRSLRTSLRGTLALKRKLAGELGGLRAQGYRSVLVRDPRDEEYPFIDHPTDFLKRPRWWYYVCKGHQPVGHMAFIVRQCFAYADKTTGKWDALLDYDTVVSSDTRLYGLPPKPRSKGTKEERYRSYWWDRIPRENQAWFIEMQCIPYERILALDTIGDFYNKPPHLLVERRADGSFFEPLRCCSVELIGPHSGTWLPAEKEKRVSFFPKRIPKPKRAPSEPSQ